MKIVNYETMMQQRPGTLFAIIGEDGMPGNIQTFGSPSPGGRDFTMAELGLGYPHLPESHANWLDFWHEVMHKDGESIPDFECYGRDGLFEYERKFVVMDVQDVQELFRHIGRCLLKAYTTEVRDIHGTLIPETEEALFPILEDIQLTIDD